jgi:hypothetical protein
MGLPWSNYDVVPSKVAKIYYIALSEKNKVLMDRIKSLENRLEDSKIKICNISGIAQHNMNCELSAALKENIQDAARDIIWPHIKILNHVHSKEAAVTLLRQNGVWEKFSGKRVLKMKYICQLINNHRGNYKKTLSNLYPSKLPSLVVLFVCFVTSNNYFY